MKKKGLLFVFLGTVLLSSCMQKKKEAGDSSKSSIENSSRDSSSFRKYDNAQKMLEIEGHLDPTKRVKSLRWEKHTKHGAAFLYVQAYLNEDGLPIKIIESFINGNFQPQGKRYYYLEDNKLIGYKMQKTIWVDTNQTKYVEKRTVYKKGVPALSQERSVLGFQDIENSNWTKIATENPSLDRVTQILNGTGRFQTHFISVINASNLFLLLGENKPQSQNRYTTAVRVDKKTPFIKDLLAHLEEYKYRPVQITFKVVGGGNQPIFRVLTSISWKDEK